MPEPEPEIMRRVRTETHYERVYNAIRLGTFSYIESNFTCTLATSRFGYFGSSVRVAIRFNDRMAEKRHPAYLISACMLFRVPCGL
jgi:hypothetical protein